MGRMIAVANQKGGVGKTTTSINLSACLAEKGKKVLLIDMDSQGNTTSGLGLEKNELDKTIYEVLRDEIPVEEAIVTAGGVSKTSISKLSSALFPGRSKPIYFTVYFPA